MNRMRGMRRLTLAAGILALAPASAMASAQGIVVMKKWQLSDKCAKTAFAEFPDYNPQSNAKREARLRQCLDSQNLPPRDGLPPRR